MVDERKKNELTTTGVRKSNKTIKPTGGSKRYSDSVQDFIESEEILKMSGTLTNDHRKPSDPMERGRFFSASFAFRRTFYKENYHRLDSCSIFYFFPRAATSFRAISNREWEMITGGGARRRGHAVANPRAGTRARDSRRPITSRETISSAAIASQSQSPTAHDSQSQAEWRGGRSAPRPIRSRIHATTNQIGSFSSTNHMQDPIAKSRPIRSLFDEPNGELPSNDKSVRSSAS